jgi:hypothetical protein
MEMLMSAVVGKDGTQNKWPNIKLDVTNKIQMKLVIKNFFPVWLNCLHDRTE